MVKVKDLIPLRKRIECELQGHFDAIKKGEKDDLESLLAKISKCVDDLVYVKCIQVKYNLYLEIDEDETEEYVIYRDIYKLQLLQDKRNALLLMETQKWYTFGKTTKKTKAELIKDVEQEIYDTKERLDTYNKRELKGKRIKDLLKKYV